LTLKTDIEKITPYLPGIWLREVGADEYQGVVKVKVVRTAHASTTGNGTSNSSFNFIGTNSLAGRSQCGTRASPAIYCSTPTHTRRCSRRKVARSADRETAPLWSQ
jgi:hypothetical protein